MSVASASQYGPYVDLQSWNGTSLATPGTSGSIYLTGSATNERVRINVGMISPKLKLGSSTEVAAVLDEDNMASDSNTSLATQQSIKAYVDSQVTAQDLDFLGDSGSGAVDLDSQNFTIAGGEGIDTSASGQTITIAGEDATAANKGVASFSSTNFSVSSGAVSLATGGVENSNYASGSIINGHLADRTVQGGKLVIGTLENDNYGSGSVENGHLAGSIANGKLANSSITLTQGAGMGTLGAVALGASITVAVDGVLEDLDTLGAASADGEFIVATGAGAFAYESGATARTSLGLGTSDNVQFANMVGVTGSFSGGVLCGSDGAGADLKVFGAAANELIHFDVSENLIKFVNSSATEFMTIGGDATTEYAIDVATGTANQNKIRAAAFVTYSDERLKSDVAPLRNALDTVNSLKAVNFTWKEDGSRDFGFLAQDLAKAVPQAVHGTEEGMFGVDYGRLTAVLVSAVQEQSTQIKALQAQLNKK